jgi:hypothetical protein
MVKERLGEAEGEKNLYKRRVRQNEMQLDDVEERIERMKTSKDTGSLIDVPISSAPL